MRSCIRILSVMLFNRVHFTEQTAEMLIWQGARMRTVRQGRARSSAACRRIAQTVPLAAVLLRQCGLHA